MSHEKQRRPHFQIVRMVKEGLGDLMGASPLADGR
jgi:hypothetical protein